MTDTESSSVSEPTAKKPRLDSTSDDNFDENNPFTQGKFPDEVELKFDDGNSLFVSKCLLSHCSPVFERMFESGFKEKNESCIEVKEKSYETFLDVLLFLHPRVQKPISDEKASVVYEIAHEYQMPPVLRNSSTSLLRQTKSLTFDSWQYNNKRRYYSDQAKIAQDHLDKAFEMLIFAETYSFTALASAATERLSVLPYNQVRAHSSYQHILDPDKMQLMKKRLLRCDPEEAVTSMLNCD